MKLISKTGAKALLLAVCGISVLSTAHANYTWRGTNSTTWGDAANWLTGSISPTNQTVANRLDVNNATKSACVYDVYCGTTVYNGTTGGRGITVGSGASGSGTLIVNGGTLITTNTGGDIVGNNAPNTGVLTVNGGTFISATPSLTLSYGGGSGCVGIINNNGGFVSINSLLLGYNSTVNFNGGTTTFTNEVNQYAQPSTNNFNGGIVQARSSTTSFIPALTQANVRNGGAIIDSAGYNITIVQPLAHSVISTDNVTDGGLTKMNAGTLTLSGTPTYTGPTVVSGGVLATPLPLNSSSLVVLPGARFSATVGTSEWLVGAAALTNASINFNYGNWTVNGYTNANLFVTNLAISGSVTCNITGTAFPVTNLTLLSYAGKTGGGSFVLGTLPSGAVGTLHDDGANVTLNITTASVGSLVWYGGDGIWQVNGGFDWNNGTAQYTQYTTNLGDVVTFDDSASGTVTITGQVNPSSTTVNVTSSFYTFAGAGSIGGTNGIAKLGTSTLEIDNANNFTGPVTVSGGSGTTGGTLFVNNAKALGATNGAVTVNGPANTLEIGVPSGNGITVSNKSVTINGTGVGGAKGALRGGSVAAGQTNFWAGPVVIGTDLSRIGTEDNGNLVVSGNITDNGANLALLLRPGINGTLTVASTGNSYAYTRIYGDATTSYINLGANNALATNRLEMGLGNLNLNGYSQTVSGINDNSGTGNIVNNGAAGSTLTIYTGTNSAASFSTGSAIQDGINKISVVVAGSGSQTFYGGSVSYSGNTTISGGTLNISSANPLNSAITVAAGGALGGQGKTTNTLTLAANSTLVVNPAAGAFTAGTVNATASPIKVLLASAVAANTPTLVLNSSNGITGSPANFQVVGVRGGTFFLTNGNTQLFFVSSGANASLVWQGNNPSHPAYWDTITTTNWSNGGTPDVFYTSDNVTFNDTASSYTVAIQGASVLPSSVTVNAANNYAFSGVIAGSTSLAKYGTGTLSLNNDNAYTGPTIISNGVVAIQTSSALGSASGGAFISGTGTLDMDTTAGAINTLNLGAKVVTISGTGYGGMGALVNNSPVAEQTYAVQQLVLAGNASVGGVSRWDVRGTGNAIDMRNTNTLTKVGGNYIALVSTTVNNPGNIVVNGGTLGIQVAASLGGSSANTLTVNNGGRLEMYQLASNPVWSLVLNNNSLFNPDYGFGGWDGPVTVNGTATLQADATLTINGIISGGGSIIKSGAQTASLTASNSYTGNTTVSAGTLSVSYPSFASGSTINVSNSAVLNLNYTGTNTVAALVLGGTSQPAGVYDATSGAPFITGSGALQVVSAGSPTMSFTNSGGSLVITFTGGTLQAQTNALSTGLGTNWADYPGSSPVTIPVNPANGSVFFRVKQ